MWKYRQLVVPFRCVIGTRQSAEWIINFIIFLRSLIDEDASVTVTILDMNALALKMFFNSLNCHASKLLEKVRKRGKTCNGAKRG